MKYNSNKYETPTCFGTGYLPLGDLENNHPSPIRLCSYFTDRFGIL